MNDTILEAFGKNRQRIGKQCSKAFPTTAAEGIIVRYRYPPHPATHQRRRSCFTRANHAASHLCISASDLPSSEHSRQHQRTRTEQSLHAPWKHLVKQQPGACGVHALRLWTHCMHTQSLLERIVLITGGFKDVSRLLHRLVTRG
jgi:hypothetical protein